MSNILLIFLISFDLVLLGLMMYSLRQRKIDFDGLKFLREIDHERRLLSELRDAVRNDLERKYSEMQAVHDRVVTLATEIDLELKSGRSLMEQEAALVLQKMKADFQGPLLKLSKQKDELSVLLQKGESSRALLQRLVGRGEQLAKFFDEKVPYEEVLEQISDKKYADARFLLTKGLHPHQVAQEVGLPESDVQLLASII